MKNNFVNNLKSKIMKNILLAIIVVCGLTACTKTQDNIPGQETQSKKVSSAATLTDYPPPVAPATGLKVELVNGNPVLTWDAVPGATIYWIGRDGRFYTMSEFNREGNAPATFTDFYAGSGVTHTYNVAAVVSEVLGGWCNEVSVTIP